MKIQRQRVEKSYHVFLLCSQVEVVFTTRIYQRGWRTFWKWHPAGVFMDREIYNVEELIRIGDFARKISQRFRGGIS